MLKDEARLAPASEEAIARLAGRLARERRLVVGAHVEPDGDAIGSMAALALALGDAGVEVYASLSEEGPPPTTYRSVPGFDLLQPVSTVPEWPVLLALDVPVLSRMGALGETARRVPLHVRVDHHPLGERLSDFDIADEHAPATSYLAWRLLLELGVEISAEAAEALWVGLVTDTGRFQYSNTAKPAFAMACDLLDRGVIPERVFRYIYDTRRLGAIKLVGLVIERMRTRLDGRLVWAWVSDEDLEAVGALREETENLVDELRSVEGAEVALFLKERPDGIRGSLRSKGLVDVAFIARVLGGGGHREAAGFPCNRTIEETVDAVQALVADSLAGKGPPPAPTEQPEAT